MALRNCTRDEGRLFEGGKQVLIRAKLVECPVNSARPSGRDGFSAGSTS
jgi:hypothetical protein